MMQAVSTEAWEFVGVCVPIVVFGAPFGSVIGTHFHRLVLATLIYIIDTVALISAFCLVPLTPWLIGTSVIIVVVGFLLFFVITKIGERLMIHDEWKHDEEDKGEEFEEGNDHDIQSKRQEDVEQANDNANKGAEENKGLEMTAF